MNYQHNLAAALHDMQGETINRDGVGMVRVIDRDTGEMIDCWMPAERDRRPVKRLVPGRRERVLLWLERKIGGQK